MKMAFRNRNMVLITGHAFCCIALSLWSRDGTSQNIGGHAIDDMKQVVTSAKQKAGRALTYDEYWSLVRKADPRLSGPEAAEVWRAVRDSQEPLIAREDLLDVLKSKRDMIHDLRLGYEKSVTSGVNDGSKVTTWNEFAASEEKLYRLGRHADRQEPARVEAYDGSVVRQYRKGEAHARIENFQGRTVFFDRSNPICTAMLVDSKRDLGSIDHWYDLVAFLEQDGTAVFEELVEVEGHTCLRATDGVTTVFLAPEMDFAVVKLEHSTINRETMSTEVWGVRSFEDFKDYGNGLWLASSVIETKIENGRPIVTDSSQLHEIAINQGIPEDFFTDIFPDGIRVRDYISGTVYDRKDNSTIAGLLDETVKRVHEDVEAAAKSGTQQEDSFVGASLDSPPLSRSRYGLVVTICIVAAVVCISSLLLVRRSRR